MRTREESGSIAPMMAIIIAVVVAISAFAVDLGLARVARQDMQSLSTAVALDMARKIDGRTAGTIRGPGRAAWEAALAESASRNATTVGSAPDLDWEVGFVDAAGAFTPAASGQVPTAVEIVAATNVGYVFARVFADDDQVGTARSAVATLDPQACFSVGALLARFDSGEPSLLGLLDDLLGLNLTGEVLSEQGLVALERADLPLLDLAAELGVATPEALLAERVSLLRLLQVASTVAHRDGLLDAAAQLDLIVERVEASAQASGVMLTVGDLLDLDTADGSALDAALSLRDLLGVALEAGVVAASASGDAYQLPLDLTVPGAATARAYVGLIEPAKIACGRSGVAQARSTQLTIALEIDLGLTVSVPLLATVTVGGDVSVAIDAAEGTAALQAVRCAAAGGAQPDQIVVRVDQTQAAGISGGARLGLTGRLLGIVPLPLSGLVDLGLSSAVASTIDRPEVVLSFDEDEELPHQFVGGDLGDLLDLDLSVSLIGISVSGLLGPLTSALGGVLSALLTPVVNHLLDGLGVDLTGVHIRAAGRPSCGEPRLVG